MANKGETSQWKIYEFNYICAVVFETDRTIGAPVVLPKYLKTGSNDIAIYKFLGYDDQLCMFRCISGFIEIVLNGYTDKDTRRMNKDIMKNYNCFYNTNFNVFERLTTEYKGIT